MSDEIEQLRKQKDAAYAERNKLVCALARYARAQNYDRSCDAWLGRHPEDDASWEKDWMNIVFIRMPTGQLTWHIHDSELPMFSFLAGGKEPEWGREAYDGHTTEQKYERLLWWRP